MAMTQNQLQDWLLKQAYGQQVCLQIKQQLQYLTGKQHYAQVLQLGLPEVALLPDAQFTQQHQVGENLAPIVADFDRLPFATESMDLVILPFVLSQHPNAHAILREAQRVVCGYGQMLVLDLNPYSLWRMQAKRLQAATGCQHEQTMTPRRLADWLQLLDMQPDLSRYINYLPLCQNKQQAQKWQWLEAAGNRWWPQAAAMYAMLAVKQTVSLKPLNQHNKRPERDNEVVLNPISVRKPD